MFKLVIILALSTLALAQEDEAGLLFFQTVDTNDDDRISWQEMETFYQALDGDSNGKVSRHEFDVFMGAIHPLFADHQAHIYDRFDKTGDHHLDWFDFDLSFLLADVNRDGFVTYDEFLNAPE